MHKEWREVAEIWHEGKLVATVTGFHLKIQENSSEDVDVAWQAEMEKVQTEYPVSPCIACDQDLASCCGCEKYDKWKENNGVFRV